MEAILWDRLPIAKIVNVKVIDLEQAPDGYKSFDAGVANKFVIDPHGHSLRRPEINGCITI
jgi:glutathione-independent formaldehyde dehydrogenase